MNKKFHKTWLAFERFAVIFVLTMSTPSLPVVINFQIQQLCMHTGSLLLEFNYLKYEQVKFTFSAYFISVCNKIFLRPIFMKITDNICSKAVLPKVEVYMIYSVHNFSTFLWPILMKNYA